MNKLIFEEPKYLPVKWFYICIGIVTSTCTYQVTNTVRTNFRLDALEHVQPAVIDEMNRRAAKRDEDNNYTRQNLKEMLMTLTELNQRMSRMEGYLKLR